MTVACLSAMSACTSHVSACLHAHLRNHTSKVQTSPNFWATVCKTVRPMLSDRCPVCLSCPVLSVLSVTFVHCGQTVGRIKMKLGMQVGLGPDHIVLGGDPAAPPLKGHSPLQFSAHICCGQMAASRCHLVWSKASAQVTLC